MLFVTIFVRLYSSVHSFKNVNKTFIQNTYAYGNVWQKLEKSTHKFLVQMQSIF